MTNFDVVLREWGARKIEAQYPSRAPVDRAKVTVDLGTESSNDTNPYELGAIAIGYPGLPYAQDVYVTGDLAGILRELFAVADGMSQGR